MSCPCLAFVLFLNALVARMSYTHYRFKLEDTVPVALQPRWLASLVAVSLCAFAPACSKKQPTDWGRPWHCWSHLLDRGYSCEPLKLSWPDWREQNKGKIAVAFACVSQEFDPESDPYDFLCRPVPSEAASN